MHRLSRFEVLIAAGVAAGLVTAALVGLPETLGAHPLWARQAGIVGSTGGGCFISRCAGQDFRMELC